MNFISTEPSIPRFTSQVALITGATSGIEGDKFKPLTEQTVENYYAFMTAKSSVMLYWQVEAMLLSIVNQTALCKLAIRPPWG